MYKQFLKYAFIGAISLAIDFAVYFSLTRAINFFHYHLIEAKIISYFLFSLFNFNYNKKWTFGKQSPYNIKEVTKYYSVSLVALAINALLMSGFLKIFMDLLAWFGAAVITSLFNFILSRFWVFGSDKEKF